MPLSGLLLVLAAAVCHATWNVFVKKVGGGPVFLWLFSLIASLIYLPFALFILLAERPAFDPMQILFILGSVLLHLGYFSLLQAGYRRGDLSVVYPTARATGPLLSSAFAVLLLGESLSWQLALGGLIIVFGVMMLGGGFRSSGRQVSVSILFGLGVGTLIGSYTAWDAYAVSVLLLPPLLMDYAITFGRVILLAPVARRNWTEVQRQWQLERTALFVVAVFSPLAYILVLYTMTFTPVV
ncbi:MAG: EamA family transporter, partial [Sulfitobacter sp.]|nr:EamA family transporter [Sulfitobacter sp.]